MHARTLRRAVVGAAAVLAPRIAVAQEPAPPPKVVTPALDFSGVILGNYSFRTDSAAKSSLGGKSPNQFTIERAYLTFRMPVGDNALIRVTTDVFQNAANGSYYKGWVVRLKHAYLQYSMLKNALGAGSQLQARVGNLHTVLIDHEEQFWARYLGQTAVERNGFFPSADGGVAAQLTLPNKFGELYGTVTNGPGYASPETDRFKDFALRLSLTPLANDSGFFKSFTISPWFYKGTVGSSFAAGGAGQVGPGTNGAITDGLARDRYGVFAGVRDRRLTAGAEYAQRKDASESGANTTVSPRVVTDSTGRMVSGFVIARPLEWAPGSGKSPVGIVARFDRFTPNTSPSDAAYAGNTPSYDFTTLGLFWEPTPKTAFAVDWQLQSPKSFPEPFPAALKVQPRQSTIFVHWQANF